MYHLLGTKNVLETIYALSLPYALQHPVTNELQLKKAYQNFLRCIQPKVPLSHSETIEFIKDAMRVQELVSLFNVDSVLNDIDNKLFENDRESEKRLAKIQESIQLIQSLYPEFAHILSLAVNALFYAKSSKAGGGTTSAAIGVIWSDCRPTWSASDTLEFFVHELGHTLTFLDEHRFQHYVNLEEASRPENYALSAILKTKRPLDKVLHSVVVGTEVLMIRDQVIGHPTSPKLHPSSDLLIDSILAAIDSICFVPKIVNLLTLRSLQILDMCKTAVLNIRDKNCFETQPIYASSQNL